MWPEELGEHGLFVSLSRRPEMLAVGERGTVRKSTG